MSLTQQVAFRDILADERRWGGSGAPGTSGSSSGAAGSSTGVSSCRRGLAVAAPAPVSSILSDAVTVPSIDVGAPDAVDDASYVADFVADLEQADNAMMALHGFTMLPWIDPSEAVDVDDDGSAAALPAQAGVFRCSFCARTEFSTQKIIRRLELHFCKQNPDRRPLRFRCSKCEFRACSRRVVKRHMRLKHPKTPKKAASKNMALKKKGDDEDK